MVCYDVVSTASHEVTGCIMSCYIRVAHVSVRLKQSLNVAKITTHTYPLSAAFNNSYVRCKSAFYTKNVFPCDGTTSRLFPWPCWYRTSPSYARPLGGKLIPSKHMHKILSYAYSESPMGFPFPPSGSNLSFFPEYFCFPQLQGTYLCLTMCLICLFIVKKNRAQK